MSNGSQTDSLFAPDSIRYARRLLGWRTLLALAVLCFYTGWGIYVVAAGQEAQRSSTQHTQWLHQLQWSEHDLLSHHPDDPAIRDAFARLTTARQQLEAHKGVSSQTAALSAGVEGLRNSLESPGERDRARTALLDAIHLQTRGLFNDLESLARSEAFRWKQLQYLAISAVAMATLALLAMLLARHRRLLAELLGRRLEGAIQEADQARQQAQRASHAKSSFLATISHELRTPMTAILGTVDLLGRTELSSRQADYLTAVRSSGETLQRLIDDVLDLSRIEAGRLELVYETFSLGELLDGLALMFGEHAERAGLSLRFTATGPVPMEVHGDSLRLRQVLVNLVGNAMKFTQQGGIELRVGPMPQDGERLRFEVEDTGLGLDHDQLERIFQPFTQADSSLTRTHGGAGLGLAICQRLVEAMEGKLEVRSEPGVGSTFSFTAKLPEVTPEPNPAVHGPLLLVGESPGLDAVARQLERWELRFERAQTTQDAMVQLDRAQDLAPGSLLLSADAQRPEHAALLTWRVLRLVPFSAAGGATEQGIARRLVEPVRPGLVASLLDVDNDRVPLPTWEPTPIAGGHRVLVVDDNEMNRLVLAEMLVTLGCRVSLAASGEQALERAAADAFDLVFMDSEMPGMDGFETTLRLREQGLDRATTPILGLSGHVTPEHRRQGMGAGMDDYLAKPIQLTTLQRAVRRWCEERDG
jgi:two-component system, sensor histidine kinase and response regulator